MIRKIIFAIGGFLSLLIVLPLVAINIPLTAVCDVLWEIFIFFNTNYERGDVTKVID